MIFKLPFSCYLSLIALKTHGCLVHLCLKSPEAYTVLHSQYTTALLGDGKAVAFLLEMLRQIVENKGYVLNHAHSLFYPFPHNTKHDCFHKGLRSKHRNISRGPGKSSGHPRKNGFIAKSLDYTSASNFFLKLLKLGPCNILVCIPFLC